MYIHISLHFVLAVFSKHDNERLRAPEGRLVGSLVWSSVSWGGSVNSRDRM